MSPKKVIDSLTSKEKQAIYQALLATMAVDGVSTDKEKAVIGKAVKQMGLSDAERQTATQCSKDESLAVLKAMNKSKKELLGDFMAQVIYADSLIHPLEEKFFRSMHAYLGLPKKDY